MLICSALLYVPSIFLPILCEGYDSDLLCELNVGLSITICKKCAFIFPHVNWIYTQGLIPHKEIWSFSKIFSEIHAFAVL